MLYSIEYKAPSSNWTLVESYSSLTYCKNVLKRWFCNCREKGYTTVLNVSTTDFSVRDTAGNVLNFRITR